MNKDMIKMNIVNVTNRAGAASNIKLPPDELDILQFCDPDIAEVFEGHAYAYVLPLLVQLTREVRRLFDKLNE